ncbi:MAG: DUF302 domain-containing protein, partial [Silvibacterium sp.]|nr:DUF302 domain-containing protein [Silvibacterium sp.]
MSVTNFTVEKFSAVSARAFEDVLAALDKGIGRPNMSKFHTEMDAATSFSELQELVHGVVGNADLMEFMRLDLGGPLRLDPAAKAYKIVRIIAGNPLIMKQMVEHLPHAGSYAPVTILVYESNDGVHITYDKMESLLAPYQNAAAL